MEFTNSLTQFDSRDMNDRINSLEDDIEEIEYEIEDDEFESEKEKNSLQSYLNELAEEFDTLNSIKEDWGDNSSFKDGILFVREDCFADYAEELAYDLGYINDDLPYWISAHIDWQAVADDLLVDYQSIELDGTTYYGRE